MCVDAFLFECILPRRRLCSSWTGVLTPWITMVYDADRMDASYGQDSLRWAIPGDVSRASNNFLQVRAFPSAPPWDSRKHESCCLHLSLHGGSRTLGSLLLLTRKRVIFVYSGNALKRLQVDFFFFSWCFECAHLSLFFYYCWKQITQRCTKPFSTSK